MSTQMSSADQLVESRLGRRPGLGGRDRRREQGDRRTARSNDGICSSRMCIVFGDDTQKRRSYPGS